MPEAQDENVRARIIELAFGGHESRYRRFVNTLRKAVANNTQVILRGSAVTGTRWEDGEPFDADGPGTSDLDVTFLGADMLELWQTFYIPKMHSTPLSEDSPDACPPLNNLRSKLCRIARRPVNLQASIGIVQYMRDVLFDQPYYTLIEKSDEDDRGTSAA
ncbi:MAG TPA: hypothetical protein VFO52_15165 [Longimicrobiales bacterium]|nr:hypothetical protein [Longimicrobiales bacterium]